MPVIDVSYEDDQFAMRVPQKQVVAVLTKALKLMGIEECELSVSFVSDRTIQDLNRTYRQKDETTDILSFPQQGGDDVFSFVDVLGDIVICLDAVDRNCEAFGVPFTEELYRLLIHGLLHLLGEDHEGFADDEPMLAHQEALLAKIVEER